MIKTGSKPRIRDHYHSHRLSFWLNLIPRLMLDQYSRRRNEQLEMDDDLLVDSFDKDDLGLRYIRHHLLDNYDNVNSYDGPVRQITLKNLSPSKAKYGVSTGTGWLRTSSSAGLSLLQMNADQSSNVPGSHRNNNVSIQDEISKKRLNLLFAENDGNNAIITNQRQNGTNNENESGENGNYSTALSVTIAVGCSLLILNMLIFAGVYYQLDRHSKSQQSSPIYLGQTHQQQTNNGNNHYISGNPNLKSRGSTVADSNEVRIH